MNETNGKLDLGLVREKLAGKSGKAYWRSLEEVAETAEFQAWVDDEFPNRSSLMQIDRRSLLKYMGASMMLAGLSGCRSLVLPNAQIVPYVNRPEEMVADGTLYFATGYSLSGFTTGVLVESHYGRPTKIEGNPNHPFSRGKTDALMQASILNLYDPDRVKNVSREKVSTSWEQFFTEIRPEIRKAKRNGGKGLAFLFESVGSPALQAEIQAAAKAMPEAIFATWEPVNRDHVYQGAELAFGAALEPVYNLEGAKVIVSLDADFLGSQLGWVKYSREWAKGRNVDGDPTSMSRLYVLESTPTVTGAMADHRMPLGVAELENFARMLAKELGVAVDAPVPQGEMAKWVTAIANDVKAQGGVVVVGDFASAKLHALGNAINAAIGAVNKHVTFHQPAIWMPGKQTTSMQKLVAALEAGDVKAVFILGGNPVFNAPRDWKIGEALKKVEHSAHLSPLMDETSKLCRWHLPESHFLEAWGDGRALDGTLTIAQPLIEPIFDSKSAWETFRALIGDASDVRPSYDLLKEIYAKQGMSEDQWRSALNNGVVPNTARPSVPVTARNLQANLGTAPTATTELDVLLRPDPTLYDGRFANNGWLQELPKPLTTITWDNTVQVSPALAEKMGLNNSDVVEVTTPAGKAKGPIWILPGQAENVVTVHYGYGRDMKETLVAAGTGFDAFPLVASTNPFETTGSIAKADGKVPLAATQTHHYLEGRDIIREQTLEEFLGPQEEKESHLRDISMYPSWQEEFPYDGPQWGMTIDLNVCTGCHACVTACQAENNIPVVGKSEVIKGREMHWIRIDRYYGSKKFGELTGNKPKSSDLENPTTHFMPLACMHCEKAPCEPVCPVAATVHSHEGLNQMVYNRCVGTRYCSNNCPYKVRRFNFLNYNDRKFSDFNPLDGVRSSRDLRVKLMVHNPDVTVRGRGVMEKCTYCVQRINEARIHAKNEFSKGRREKPDPKEGEVVTACQQACPTEAIVFGNIMDANSEVARKKKLKRNYTLIEELNTKNRTTYLVKLRNPNKELETA